MKKYRILLISFSIACFSIVGFNSLDSRRPFFEAGIYYAYLDSIIKDQDFNIANNVTSEMSWILSPTYNMPAMHDSGISVLWLPLGIIGHFLDKYKNFSISSSRGESSFLEYSVLVSTFFLIGLGLLMLSKVVRPQTKIERIVFLVFPLTSPLLYYGLFEFGSADVGAFFWACLTLYIGDRLGCEKKDAFLWGLAFAIGRIIKISFVFWLPYFLYILWKKSDRSKKTSERTNIFLSFFLGSGIVFLLQAVNSFRQFGFFSVTTGYLYDFEFPRPSVLDSLYSNFIGPYGIFYIGLWVILGIIFFAIVFYQKKCSSDRKVWLFLSFSVFFKFIYECLCVSDNETEFGFRRYLIDLPFLIWMSVLFFRSLKSKEEKLRASLVMSLLFVWALWYLFWFLDVDRNYFSAFGIYRWWEFGHPGNAFLSFLKVIYRSFSRPDQIYLGCFIFFLSLFVITFGQNKLKDRWLIYIVPVFFTIYFALTALNFYFNPLNIEKMRSELKLEKKVISDNISTLLYDEILSELSRSMLIAKYTKNKSLFDRNRKNLNSYLAKIPSHILSDPIHFINDLSNGKLRRNYYNSEVDLENLNDFQAASFYDQQLGLYCKPKLFGCID